MLPVANEPLQLIDEEIAHLLFMTQQLSAAAAAAPPGSAAAAACAATLRMRDRTLMHALETRAALEAAAQAAAQELMWHHAANAPVTAGWGPAGVFEDSQLASTQRAIAEDQHRYSRHHHRSQQLHQHKCCLPASDGASAAPASTPAPPPVQTDRTLRRMMQHISAVSREQPGVHEQLLQLLPML